MFKKIVVGLDGSEASEKALRIACDLAQRYGSEMHIVHPPQMETLAVYMGAGGAVAVTPSQTELDAVGTQVIENGCAIAKECGQKVAKTHLVHGNAADQILQCTEDCGADLIVTARRGLGSITGLVLGSTSQRISHLAKCAYLSVA